MFWMDLIPCKELCKRLEPSVPIPSGASVPPPRVPAVCTVLPCSRVVVNEVKQQVNKQANEPEVRSQVLPAALAGLRTMRSFAASKKKKKQTHKASKLLMESQ